MIYFDTCATSLQKPAIVMQQVTNALHTFGNPGRSFHTPSMLASRTVYNARKEIATLVNAASPHAVAFTSGATESLNLVCNSLITSQDHVITSVLEHNSVLRPLYRIGCTLSYIPCNDHGELMLDALPSLLQKNSRFLVCTHGSNLTGAITDTRVLNDFCKAYGLIFILDVSQTLGSIETRADMADILCFTGHKALMGLQGTGGIIAEKNIHFPLVKTGGSGTHSFYTHQSLEMPEVFEAGTANAHGLAGLHAGVTWLHQLGLPVITKHEAMLRSAFLSGISHIPQIQLYHPKPETQNALPVVACNIGDLSASDVALMLWENYHIATRAGTHCAPFVHQFFHTEKQGMVRFSFGYFNTLEEVEFGVKALSQIARDRM